MSVRGSRLRSGWVAWSSVGLAALAAAALAVTVVVAQRGLSNASRLVVRGEGEALVAALEEDLRAGAEDDGFMERELSKYESQGLRYVAVMEREGGPARGHAGVQLLDARPAEPGELTIRGRRVRLTAPAPPPRGGPPHGPDAGRRGALDREPPPRDDGPPGGPGPGDHDRPGPGLGPPGHPPFGSPPPEGGPGAGPPHGPPPLLVIEFEPPVFEQLQSDAARTVVVGAVAGIVLFAFALAWSRNLLRLAAVERQAERERRLVSLGQMASVMAHELRNPLASLKGHAQLLCETLEGDDKAHAKAERVVSEAERLERLTVSLLDFVRDGPLDRRAIGPAELFDLALEGLGRERVRLDLAGAPREVSVDAPRLSRALHNLVHNALQASPDEREVEVSLLGRGADLVIEVRDHGPGLPAEQRAQIFEPFVTTRVRGTGLGLPVARRIAEQHGGTLDGSTHPEGGAVFRLELPDAVSKA